MSARRQEKGFLSGTIKMLPRDTTLGFAKWILFILSSQAIGRISHVQLQTHSLTQPILGTV